MVYIDWATHALHENKTKSYKIEILNKSLKIFRFGL